MQTYRFRAYPAKAQIQMLESTLYSCRQLYNAMLQQRICAYRSGKHVNYNSQRNEFPEIRKRFPEYSSIHPHVTQEVAHRGDKVYDNFFRRIREKRMVRISGRDSRDSSPRTGTIQLRIPSRDSR